ncbi:MAG: hypothetical protein H7A33_00850 [Deltaproteobacteria bacterium]|nr:hypothetical protein [Deltaproteobacteria bacterium]
MAEIQNFPFNELTHYTRAEAALYQKLLKTFFFFEKQSRFFEILTEPLDKICQQQSQLSITHFEARTSEELAGSLPKDSLISVLRIDPHCGQALLTFDSLLAKALAHQVVSGEIIDPKKISDLQLKPLSSMEEAVVQYLLVSILDQISQNISHKNFSLQFEDLFKNPKSLHERYKDNEQFGVYTVMLKLFGRDFFLRLILPVASLSQFAANDYQEALKENRLKQFGNLEADFSLEVAEATMAPEDFFDLEEGDVILFDEGHLKRSADHKGWQGKAELVMNDPNERQGFGLNIEQTNTGWKGKVTSAL